MGSAGSANEASEALLGPKAVELSPSPSDLRSIPVAAALLSIHPKSLYVMVEQGGFKRYGLGLASIPARTAETGGTQANGADRIAGRRCWRAGAGFRKHDLRHRRGTSPI